MNINNIIRKSDRRLKELNIDELENLGILPFDDSYIPIIIYPSYTKTKLSNETKIFKNFSYDKLAQTTLYIHIPFCKKLCSFCQYDTAVIKNNKEIDVYLAHFKKELILWTKKLKKTTLSPTAIFIGGGTPSLLSPKQFEKLFKILLSCINLANCEQISIDVEPGTVCDKDGLTKLKIMNQYGIERICLGAQSFNDNILKIMNRSHNYKDILNSIKNIKKVGFKSLSIDLIYGFSQSTPEMWAKTLIKAHSLKVDSYQLYQLRTILFKPTNRKNISVISEKQNDSNHFLNKNEIYKLRIINKIISESYGFKAVGRDTFMKDDKHNSKYLVNITYKGHDFLGIGFGAGSSLRNKILKNTADSLNQYYSFIDNDILPIKYGASLNKDDLKRKFLILSLKNCSNVSKGIYSHFFKSSINSDFNQELNKLKKFKLIGEDNQKIFFTLKGSYFVDKILLHFFKAKYIPIQKSSYKNTKLNPYNQKTL